MKKFFNSPPSLGRRMKASKCSTRGFLSSKRILKASQTWKLPIGIFVRWKVLRHSMCRFCNEFLQNLEIRTLCWMCITFLKSWNWLMHTMRPPSRLRPQPPLATLIRSSHFFSRVKAVHSVAPILPSCNYYDNPAHKANECNIPSKDLFYDYCGK